MQPASIFVWSSWSLSGVPHSVQTQPRPSHTCPYIVFPLENTREATMGVQYQVLLIVIIGGCCAGFIQPRQKREVDASDRAEGERISATGGGIVRQGSNVTLSLYVGDVWDR